MIPQIFSIGPLPVNSFGLMIALALCACIYRISISFEHNGIDPVIAERYTFTGVLVGLVGARILYVIEFYDTLKHDLLGALFSTAGFTFYGGLVLSALVLYIMAKRDKLDLSCFVDSLGPTLVLGYAIGRLGCQLSGDGDYGIVTDSWLGMSYATGVIPTPPGVLVYPTPLFESIISFAILFILLKIEVSSKWQVPYRRFGLYCVLMGLERFFIEFLRINPKYNFNPTYNFSFSEAQYIATVIFFLGVCLLLYSLRVSRLADPKAQ